MKITDVKVFPVDEDKLKAYATITFENCFIVRDLKVISGNKGYFIAMPSKKRKDGTFRDVAHPLNSETRKMIEDAVLEVYERENVHVSPAPSYHEDISTEVGSSSMDPEGDAHDGNTMDTSGDEMDLQGDDPGSGSPEGDTMAAGSDEPGLSGDDPGSEFPEGDTIAADSDELGLDDDAEADAPEGNAIDNAVDTDEGEGIRATATEVGEGEAAVKDTGPVTPDQPEEIEKGAEENPVIEPSDDPEKAFGYEE